MTPPSDGAVRVGFAPTEAPVVAEVPNALPGLPALGAAFDLTDPEATLLSLLVPMEFAEDGAAPAPEPTVSWVLARVPGLHLGHLAPSAPLRRFGLVDVRDQRPLGGARVDLGLWTLHHLVGLGFVAPEAASLLVPVPPPRSLPESWRPFSARLVSRLHAGTVVQVAGEGRAGVVADAACQLQRRCVQVPARALGDEEHAGPRSLRGALERELRMSRDLLLVEAGDAPLPPGLLRWVSEQPAAVVGSAHGGSWPGPSLELPPLTDAERTTSLLEALGAEGDADAVAALARRYRVGADAVTRIAAGAATALAAGDSPDAVLAEAEAHCRSAAREGLDQLARRVEVRARWTDLVLPEASVGTLREMVTHLRHREQVHERWGVADKSARGLGLVGLFSGPSGTGKTMAAEVIASELGLDLYVIDLSAVVSKYIGETEKNLARVFDAAESCGAVLLFDEADALFGKRSEVKDSHDRYANIEVGYLLARIEAYRGLAILTTNTKDALDPAFLRRFTFALEFKAPDAGERAALWTRLWPEALPQAGLDVEALAAVPLTGGHIRNTIVRAAFLAAEDGSAVGMRHVRRALHSELTKLGRPAPKEWRR